MSSKHRGVEGNEGFKCVKYCDIANDLSLCFLVDCRETSLLAVQNDSNLIN